MKYFTLCKKAIKEVEFDVTWGQFKSEVFNVKVEVLGLVVSRRRNWFEKKTISRSLNFSETNIHSTRKKKKHRTSDNNRKSLLSSI